MQLPVLAFRSLTLAQMKPFHWQTNNKAFIPLLSCLVVWFCSSSFFNVKFCYHLRKKKKGWKTKFLIELWYSWRIPIHDDSLVDLKSIWSLQMQQVKKHYILPKNLQLHETWILRDGRMMFWPPSSCFVRVCMAAFFLLLLVDIWVLVATNHIASLTVSHD